MISDTAFSSEVPASVDVIDLTLRPGGQDSVSAVSKSAGQPAETVQSRVTQPTSDLSSVCSVSAVTPDASLGETADKAPEVSLLASERTEKVVHHSVLHVEETCTVRLIT